MIRSRWRSYLWGIRLLLRAHPIAATTMGCLAMASGAVPAITLYASKLVVDSLVVLITAGGQSPPMKPFFLALGLQLGLLLLTGLLSLASDFAASYTGTRYATQISEIILRKVTRLDATRFEQADFYDRVARAHGHALQSPLQLVTLSFNVIRSSVSIVSASIVLASISWPLLGIAWVAGAPTLILGRWIGRARFEMIQARTARTRLLAYLSANLLDPFRQGEIRLFGIIDFLMDRWRRLKLRTDSEDISMSLRTGVSSLGGDLFSHVGTAGATAYLGTLAVRTGGYTVGTVLMGAGSFKMTSGSIRLLLELLAQLYAQLLFIENLRDLLTHEQNLECGDRALSSPGAWHRLELRNVGFKYPNRSNAALQDVSLVLEPGQHLAIVGHNGSGKSTLLKLLIRHYDPQQGTVLLDGNPLPEYDLQAFRSLFSMRFDLFGRYTLTFRENIELDGDDTGPGFAQAVRLAGLESLLEECDNGEALLGRQLENGRELSEGQWSRLAFARAAFRQAPIIVLDEPTAYLDPMAERTMIDSIRELTVDKTLILVSHRPTVVEVADKVLFLENGRVQGYGAPEELSRACPGFASWFADEPARPRPELVGA